MFNNNSSTTAAAEIKNLCMSEKGIAESDRLLKVFSRIMRETANKLEASREALIDTNNTLKGASERTKSMIIGGIADRTMDLIRREVGKLVEDLREQEEVHGKVMGKASNVPTTSNNDDDDDDII